MVSGSGGTGPMRLGAIDEILSEQARPGALPLRLEQRSSRISTLFSLLLVIPVAAVCLLPFALVAAVAAAQPDALTNLIEHPLVAAQLAAGFLLTVVLVTYPALTIGHRLGRVQTVAIDAGIVSVNERSLFGTRQWSAPLAAFSGVAHHIRASLSGARHEIVLVHNDLRRSLLLHVAERVQESELEQMAALLGRPVVPGRAIYRAQQTRTDAVASTAA